MTRITLMVCLFIVGLMAYGCGNEPLTTEDEEYLLAPKSVSLPHDGGCVSYCARAKLHVWYDDDDESGWMAVDFNGDGKIQSCHKEIKGFLGPDGEPIYEGQCHKAVDPITGVPVCPEYAGRCLLPADYDSDPNLELIAGVSVACILQHGNDTHN